MNNDRPIHARGLACAHPWSPGFDLLCTERLSGAFLERIQLWIWMGYQIELLTLEIWAAERLQLMKLYNRWIIDFFCKCDKHIVIFSTWHLELEELLNGALPCSQCSQSNLTNSWNLQIDRVISWFCIMKGETTVCNVERRKYYVDIHFS